MRKSSALLLLGLCALSPVAALASGGTCASPSGNFQDGSDSGNTCTDGATNQVSVYCVAQNLTNQPQEVYAVALGAAGPNRTATSISISSATSTNTFNPTIYFYPTSGGCAAGGPPCGQTGTASAPLDLTGLAAGNYFLVVGASQLDATAATSCGDFTLTANGTLPVKLNSFSVD